MQLIILVSLFVSGCFSVDLGVPIHLDKVPDPVPAPYDASEGWIYSKGDTQEKKVLQNPAGYWPCIRTPKGKDERYPVYNKEGGGFFTSGKYCDLEKQPGQSVYSCRAAYTLKKAKNFPKLPSPYCFERGNTTMDKAYVRQIDDPIKQGSLCDGYIGKSVFTPAPVLAGIASAWINIRTQLQCPENNFAQSAATKEVYCQQVFHNDMAMTCGYAKTAKTREMIKPCWDVCADTMQECPLAKVGGLGSLMSSQDFEPKEFIGALTATETVDNWCMLFGFDNVCYPMSHYYPEGKLTRNSCYPDGVNSLDAAGGLPTDHSFADTPGNFKRTDGKKSSDMSKTGVKSPTSNSQGTYIAMVIGWVCATLF